MAWKEFPHSLDPDRTLAGAGDGVRGLVQPGRGPRRKPASIILKGKDRTLGAAYWRPLQPDASFLFEPTAARTQRKRLRSTADTCGPRGGSVGW